MSKPKMIPEAPVPEKPGLSPFQRTADLTRRLLQVPKSAVIVKPKKALRKHR
jgi:hypothetical protein